MTSNNSHKAKSSHLNRRDFLKVMASGTFTSLITPRLQFHQTHSAEWPTLRMEQLPREIQGILELTPDTLIRDNGHLAIRSGENDDYQDVPLLPTQWNIENSNPWNELDTNVTWGIVLHWFGDRLPEQGKVDFYLRGFNGIRQYGDHETSTSAHFLVGKQPTEPDSQPDSLGIIQTQKPGPGGVQYEAAHIRYLDYNAFKVGQHYFILALNELNKKYPQVQSILQHFFTQPGVYPHMRTIGIEITGHNFDDPQNYPGDQKIANVLSLVWALMNRYQIPATNIIGHNEIQLSKSDPGKKFLALIKFLLGVKVLLERDDAMRWLVFGPFFNNQISTYNAVLDYFEYLRGYLLLIATPRQISEWDAWTKYFILREILLQGYPELSSVEAFYPPVTEPFWHPGYRYLQPDNHEGIDIYPDLRKLQKPNNLQDIHLLASGVCIYLGRSQGLHDGLLAIFRHRQVDGSEVISSYGHLDTLSNISVGDKCTGGQVIGQIRNPSTLPHGYLHFSLAYGPSWEMYLYKNGNIPLNVGPTWIKKYFISPEKFFANKSLNPGDLLKNFNHIPL